MIDPTVEDFNGKMCEYRDTLEPLDAGNTPASPGQLDPGSNVDSNPDSANPGPMQRWPYGE